MIRKLFILLALIFSVTYICNAQGRYKININASNNKAIVSSVDIAANNTNICVSMRGKIIIDPNIGGQPAGDIAVTYYDQYDGPDNIGKLKSIDKLIFTYYDRFDGPDNPGRLKAIGNTKITYYDKYDGFDNIGKLKAVGNVTITYYDRFDTSEAMGVIKQINGNSPNINVYRLQGFNADNN